MKKGVSMVEMKKILDVVDIGDEAGEPLGLDSVGSSERVDDAVLGSVCSEQERKMENDADIALAVAHGRPDL